MSNSKTVLVIGFDCLIDKLVKMYEPFREKSIFKVQYLSMSKVDYLSPTYKSVKERTKYGSLIYLALCVFFIPRKKVQHIEVYFDSAVLAFVTVLIARLKRVPVIGVCRGSEVLCLDNFNFRRRYLLTKSYSLVNRLILKELYMAEILNKAGISSDKFHHIHNVLPESFDFSCQKFSSDSQEFVFLNSIKKWRNVLTMVYAFHEVYKVKPYAKLKIIGFSNENSYLSHSEYEGLILDYIHSNSLEKCIEIIPFSADAWRYIEKSRAYILYADIIWLNNSMLEACGYGIPLIISNEDGSEVFKDGAYIVENHNANALKDAMLTSLSNNDDCNKKSINIKRIAMDSFRYEQYFETQLAFYSNLNSDSV